MERIASKLEQKYPVHEELSEGEHEAALDLIIKNGITVQGMITFTTGIFLADFALRLGATNIFIGLLSSIRIFSQMLQIPSVYLIDRIKIRRAICVYFALISRSMVFVIALIPFLFSVSTGLYILFFAILIKATFAAVVGCSWNSWMRDLIPHDQLGAFFGKRLFYTTLFGMILSLAAGLFMDWWGQFFPNAVLKGYSLLFVVGFASGMLGIYHMTLTPELRMVREEETGLLESLKKPFADKNYRRLLVFSMFWNFSVNLVAPFFTVYLLKRLELSLSIVVVFGVLSQLSNLMFFRIWGNFADRFSNKAVMALSGILYLLTILTWTYTTFPDKHFLTVPLLTMIHVMLGISSAGVALASGNIGLKLAPRGGATSYLAALNFANAGFSGLGPVIGGLLAGFSDKWQFDWSVSWISPAKEIHIQILNISQLDFLFLVSFLVGLYSLRRLTFVNEEGRVKDAIDISDLISEVGVEMRSMSTMGGLRYLRHLPVALLFAVFKLKIPKNSQCESPKAIDLSKKTKFKIPKESDRDT